MEAEDFVEFEEIPEHLVGLIDIQPYQYEPELTLWLRSLC